MSRPSAQAAAGGEAGDGTTPAKPPRGVLRLSSRDVSILKNLGDYRFLSIPQLSALHFDSSASAESRVRKLWQAELAIRVFVPVRPYDRTAHTIYALSGKGARQVVEAEGGVLPKFLSERERRSGLFLDHTLRRNDVRVCLELLDRDCRGFTLLQWQQSPEEVGSSALVKGRGKTLVRVPIVPDGVAVVRYRGAFHVFVIEIDMGTVRLERMELRYKGYWKWWKAGGALTRCGLAPVRVLTLTTTDRRLQALRASAARAPESGRAGSALFWFASLTAADLRDPTKLLTAPWTLAVTAGGEEPRALLDLHS